MMKLRSTTTQTQVYFELKFTLMRPVVALCTIEVDLTPLKPFAHKLGSQGFYYEVYYEIGVTFGQELEFKLMSEGRVLASVKAEYV